MTAAGLPIDGAISSAKGVSDRALSAGADTFAAQQRLRETMAQSGPGQASDWLAMQAQRLGGSQSGIGAAGASFPGASVPGPGAAGASPAAQETEARLRALLAKPLVIEVRTDSRMIQAEVERRTDIQMRRGG